MVIWRQGACTWKGKLDYLIIKFLVVVVLPFRQVEDQEFVVVLDRKIVDNSTSAKTNTVVNVVPPESLLATGWEAHSDDIVCYV